MSKIPKAPKLKQPASLSKTADSGSVEHEDLLKLSWRKLDALVDRLFSMKPEQVEARKSKSIGEYLDKWRAGAEIAREKAAQSGNAEIKFHYSRIAKEIEDILAEPIAEIDPSDATATIIDRILEREIVEEKGRGFSTRSEVVGFVDIEVTIGIPETLTLSHSLPYCLQVEEESAADLLWDSIEVSRGTKIQERNPEQVELYEIKGYSPNPPAWHAYKKQAEYWIDIRTAPKPIGMLLRELKTLREYAPGEVIVVMETIGPEELLMLKNERFGVITREILESL